MTTSLSANRRAPQNAGQVSTPKFETVSSVQKITNLALTSFAANLDEQTRTLIEKLHPTEQLKPLQDVARAFANRCKESGKELALPEKDNQSI